MVLGGLAFLLINGTIGQARVIPSGSMENTLLIGDHLIMSRIGLRRRGAVHELAYAAVAQSEAAADRNFQTAFAPDTPDYVKRVIGLPGDTIDIHDGSACGLTDSELTEPYAVRPSGALRTAHTVQSAGQLLFCDGRQSRRIRTTAASGAAFRARILLVRR